MNPTVIGELMNNSYARARRAWSNRDLNGYRELAALQTRLGASFLTLNTDGTQKLAVTLDEMLEFLPKVIPAIQDVTDRPISFDNPAAAFHEAALRCFDRRRSAGRPILNSLAVSRRENDRMIELVHEYDLMVIVMASERIFPDGSHGAGKCPEDIVHATRHFVERLQKGGKVTNDRIIVDPGLCPLASDTHGGVNLCLDSIRAIRADSDLAGIHISVGLSNFSIGSPPHLRVTLERALLALATGTGLDFALSNPEKNTKPLEADDPWVLKLRDVLDTGRRQGAEPAEDAGYRQLDALMDWWADAPAPAPEEKP